MKKIFAAAFCGVVLSASIAVPAHATGLEERIDGSDHGQTGKIARVDPQADKGKDCVEHGVRKGGERLARGGINEDHCGLRGGTQS